MPSFDDIAPHKTPAASTDIQQIIDALTGRRNTPLASITNDPLAFALTLKNTDASGKAEMILAPDGTTVLFSVDATGVKVSAAGGAAVAPLTDVGPGAAQVAIGNHAHGSGGYVGTGAVTLEALFAGATVVTAVNYVVATGVMYVFCNPGVTLTLPSAVTTNRPITVVAVGGTTTVTATAGLVRGGSTNFTTGVIMDGVVSPGDSMTYKSNTTDWRVV